jgi:hypothetical protein
MGQWITFTSALLMHGTMNNPSSHIAGSDQFHKNITHIIVFHAQNEIEKMLLKNQI